MNLKDYIASVQDFPIEGILFRDITPLMANGEAFQEACNRIRDFAQSKGATVIVGPESRGFIFGCPVAKDMGIGFIPVRKPNKLPAETIKETYSLEYGTDTIEMHTDAIKPGDRVVIIDDLLATGGTASAACNLIKKAGGEVAAAAFIIELTPLKGRAKIEEKGVKVVTMLDYDLD